MTGISVVINPYTIQASEEGEIAVTQTQVDGSMQRIWLTLDQVEIFCAHLGIVAKDLREGKAREVSHG